MNKQEFLKGLEEALLEQMDISEAASHIRYYRDYIESEVRKGRDEEEVVASLQSPRLIAKTIVNSADGAKKYDNNVNEFNNRTYNTADTGSKLSFSINGKPINSIIFKLILGLILILVLMVVLVILGGIFWILFRVVLPVAIIVGVISFVIKYLKK